MKSDKGFTLIEALVYSAIFGLLMAGLLASVYSIFASAESLRAKNIIQADGDFLLAKIEWALNSASAVSVNTGQMVLTVARASQPAEIKIYQESGLLKIKRNGAAAGVQLNSFEAIVADLVFEHLAAGLPEESIAVGFSLQTKLKNGALLSQDFSTKKYLNLNQIND